MPCLEHCNDEWCHRKATCYRATSVHLPGDTDLPESPREGTFCSKYLDRSAMKQHMSGLQVKDHYALSNAL